MVHTSLSRHALSCSFNASLVLKLAGQYNMTVLVEGYSAASWLVSTAAASPVRALLHSPSHACTAGSSCKFELQLLDAWGNAVSSAPLDAFNGTLLQGPAQLHVGSQQLWCGPVLLTLRWMHMLNVHNELFEYVS